MGKMHSHKGDIWNMLILHALMNENISEAREFKATMNKDIERNHYAIPCTTLIYIQVVHTGIEFI